MKYALALALALTVTGCVTEEVRDSALIFQDSLRTYTRHVDEVVGASGLPAAEKEAFAEAGAALVAHADELERLTR